MCIRTVVATVAGCIATAFFIFSTPNYCYVPHGIALPSAARSAISADQVTIYEDAPYGNIVRVGEVRAELAYHTLTPETKKPLFDQVKKLAASMGANGVVVNVLLTGGELKNILTFVGTAVYIQNPS